MQPNADNLIASRFDTVIYDLDGTLIRSNLLLETLLRLVKRNRRIFPLWKTVF